MARPIRIEFPGAIYHVMNRGLRKQTIFLNNGQRKAFLKYLEEAVERFQVRCLAYCLMGNHYHLLLQTPHPNLSRVMRHIDGLYTQQFNRFEGLDGPLFRGRYKSILVDSNEYLLQVLRYIHLNPQKAGLEKIPGEYPWSCLRHYLGFENPPQWLSMDIILENLGNEPHKKYFDFISHGVDSNTERFYNQEKKPLFYGGKSFPTQIQEKINEYYKDSSFLEPLKTRIEIHPDDICKAVSRFYDINHESIFHSTRGKENLHRKIAIYLCKRYSLVDNRSLERLFKLNSSRFLNASYKEISERIIKDSILAKDINSLTENLGVKSGVGSCGFNVTSNARLDP